MNNATRPNPPQYEDEQGQPDIQPSYSPAPAPQAAQPEQPGQQPQYQPYPQQAPAEYSQAPYNGQVPPPPGYDNAQRPAAAPMTPAAASKSVIITSAVAFVGVTLIGLGFLLGGEPAKFMTVGVQFIPLALLAALAYGGLKNTASAVFAYVWLGVVALGVLFNAFGSALLAMLQDPAGLAGQLAVTSLDELFKPRWEMVLLWTTLLLMLVVVLSLLVLWRPVRVLLARIMPIDPDNFVHKIALSILVLITLGSFVPLVAMGGTPPLLELVSSGTVAELNSQVSEEMGLAVRPIDLVYQFVWTIPATFVAAGWPIVRTFKAMLVRLAFVRPTLVQVVGATVGGVVLAAIAGFGLDPGINWLWRQMGWGTTNVEAFSQLMSQLLTPVGAVLIGVTAGIGEELAVRGLLQPRIGLIASNLVFTSLHAYQYGLDALLSVFIIGLVLGLIRARTNTSTSAIVHGVYNFTLVMASIYIPPSV